ncbi:MAG: acyl carrier protein [Bacteroidales bacterium]|nr:acyl carrier protein [Bacteroidales bacterium]
MKTKVINLLKEVLEIEDRNLELNDKFRDYDEWDSLAYLSLIAGLDEEFEILIENNQFNLLITVEDLIKAIEEKMK